MKALVIGGNGFIGSHLVDKLLSEKASVRVLDIYPEKYRLPLKGVDYRYGRLSDTPFTDEALADIDIVFHIASTTVPSTSNINPAADIQENLIPLVYLLNQMIKYEVKKIVFLSSGGAVYGNPEIVPTPETQSLRPISSYGIVKTAMEHYLLSYGRMYGIKPIIVRPSNAYGPRQGHAGVQGVIGTLLFKAMTGEVMTIWGDGSIIRDYVFVEDLIECCYQISLKVETGIFNVASGIGYTVKQIVELIAQITGASQKIQYEAKRSYDPEKIVLDISKVQLELGWKPKIDLPDGIRRQWIWFKEATLVK
jgi:UDP-glucose 4-epimerase